MREPTNPRPGYPYPLCEPSPTATLAVTADRYRAEQVLYTTGLIASCMILALATWAMIELVKQHRRERRYRPSRWAIKRGGY